MGSPSILILFGFLALAAGHHLNSFSRYKQARSSFIRDEHNRGVGATLQLNSKEERVNSYIMQLKEDEIKAGLLNPPSFAPAQHFFEVLKQINGSDLYEIIREMPKGGALHVHDTALCNLDFFVKLTYWDNLWTTWDATQQQPMFRFNRTQPDAGWTLVKDERARRGAQVYDAELRAQMSMYSTNPILDNRDINSAWVRFEKIFDMDNGIMKFRDVRKAYYLQALAEFEADGVNYLEFRTTLSSLYDLDNRRYGEEEVVQLLYETTQEFKRTHPKFMGAKLIYSPARAADDARIDYIIEMARKLIPKYPDFIAGFDLVAQEDKGRPLIDFAKGLLTLPSDIKFFFHAGETNWNGVTDDNLIDAILLGTTRIGHGYAITKHPTVLDMVKKYDVAIEVQPISNQVLRLVADTRNHPANVLFSDNYPVVISSDDPSFWEATPLSHDFYYAFLGIASSRQDLRVLKQLAMNSIKYSAASPKEKRRNMSKWHTAWDTFVNNAINELGL